MYDFKTTENCVLISFMQGWVCLAVSDYTLKSGMWVFGFLCLCFEVRNVGIWFLVTMLWGHECGYLVSCDYALSLSRLFSFDSTFVVLFVFNIIVIWESSTLYWHVALWWIIFITFCISGVSLTEMLAAVTLVVLSIWKESAFLYSCIIYFLPKFTFTIWKYWAAIRSRLVYFYSIPCKHMARGN